MTTSVFAKNCSSMTFFNQKELQKWYNKGAKTEELNMAMTNRNNVKFDCIIMATLEDLVPQNHLVRTLESAIDWKFIYPLAKPLYSEFGRRSIDPVVLFKMIFINYTFGINSMRKTCEEIKVNVAYRWFLGIDIFEEVPNYSTWSKNYERRYKDSEVFNQIFNRIIQEGIQNNFIDTTTVFGDGTHRKASANTRKAIDQEVEIVAKAYEKELLEEINADRQENGKKAFESLVKKEYAFDEQTGEEIEVKKTKHIKQSTTDPECGLFHKGEKQKCFAYTHMAICDKNGYVLFNKVAPGNMHDSAIFTEIYGELIEKYPNIQNVCLDSGFNISPVCHQIISSGRTPYLPYKRPMTAKGHLKKKDYVYDEKLDIYICPEMKDLHYVTTNREGYKVYKSNPKDCEGCPLLGQCTQSKKHEKVITRHVWEAAREEAEHIRYTDKWKKIYPQRKQTIERVFADAKENHGMRFTRLKGLQKNQHESLIIFSCHNLKKMGLYKNKIG